MVPLSRSRTISSALSSGGKIMRITTSMLGTTKFLLSSVGLYQTDRVIDRHTAAPRPRPARCASMSCWFWRALTASTYPITICPRVGKEPSTVTPTTARSSALSRRPKSGGMSSTTRAPGVPGLGLTVEHADEPEVLGVDDPVDVLPAPPGAVVVHHRHQEPLDVQRELIAEEEDQQQRHHDREPQVRGVAEELPRLLPRDGQCAVTAAHPTHGRARLLAAR
jgi:hypothetical protein